MNVFRVTDHVIVRCLLSASDAPLADRRPERNSQTLWKEPLQQTGSGYEKFQITY
jgi:hypothetical protein